MMSQEERLGLGIPRARPRWQRVKSLTTTTATLLPSFLALIWAFVLLEVPVDAARRSRFGFAPKTRLTWVNGIGYNTSHMEKEAPVISSYFGGKDVKFYHNPTKMVDEQDTRGYFSDLTQAGQQKYLGRITDEVNGLVKHLREAVRSIEGNRGGTVVHIAHSQGALVTWLAAKQLTPLEMNRIEVISFGGATPVRSTPETPFRRCVNYYSVNDPLLFLNPSAETALRSGFHRHHHNHHKHNGDAHAEEMEDEFCFLAPRVGDPIADHMLLGPTYASALEWEGRRFVHRYQSYLQRIIRYALLTSLAIFKTVLQLVAFIWQTTSKLLSEWKIRRRSMVRSCIAAILAIRSWFIAIATALLSRILADIRGLVGRSTNTALTGRAAPTPVTEGSAEGSAPQGAPPLIDPTIAMSADQSSRIKSVSLLRFAKRARVTESTSDSPEVPTKDIADSRWMPFGKAKK